MFGAEAWEVKTQNAFNIVAIISLWRQLAVLPHSCSVTAGRGNPTSNSPSIWMSEGGRCVCVGRGNINRNGQCGRPALVTRSGSPIA